MDAELLAMEDRWYLNSQNCSPSYWGLAVEPDSSCYAIVANAYSNADMGEEGAKRAEELVERLSSKPTLQIKTNRVLLSAVVKAWARADNWVKANEWLERMKASESQNSESGPDVFTYTTYLEALYKSNSKSNDEIKQEALNMLEEMKKLPNENARPNAYTYASVMKCVSRSNDMERVEALLQERIQMYHDSGKELNMKPSARDYSAVVDAWAKAGRGLEGAKRADALLQELKTIYKKTGDFAYRPNEYVYASVLTAYSRIVDPDDVLVALRRTDQLIEDFEQDPSLSNSAHVYSAAMQVRVNEANQKGAEEAEALLRRMTSPDRIAYQTVILAYASRDQPQQAHRLLSELACNRKVKEKNMVSLVTLAACINSWLRSEAENKMNFADDLVRRIGAMYREGNVKGNELYRVDRWIFNAVITGWKESKRSNAGEKVESLMEVMMNDFKGTPVAQDFAPIFETYAMALDAWAASGHVNCGSRALRLLQEVEEQHYLNPRQFPKANNRVLYPTLLSVVKSGENGMIQMANDLFSQMCQLRRNGEDTFDINTRTTTSILREFAKNPADDAGYRAECLLQHVIELSNEGDDLFYLRPGTIEFNCVINVHAKKGSIEKADKLLMQMKAATLTGDLHMKPSINTYSSLLEGLINDVDRRNAVMRAETLFNEVLQRYKEGDDSLKPDGIIFNTMFNLLAKVGVQPGPLVEKGFALLDQMRQLKIPPTIMIYSILCRMCLNDGTEASMDLLQKLITDAETMAQSGKSPPLARSFYEQALTAYMYSKAKGSKEKAKALFEHMETLVRTGKVSFQVDRSTVHIFLAAWARSGDAQSVQEATILLEKMKTQQDDANMAPTIGSYNWVLLATALAYASSTDAKKNHFAVAAEQFKAIHEQADLEPNHITYDSFLKACWKCLPTGRSELIISKAFALCAKNGCVSSDVLNTVTRRAPEIVNAALAREGIFSIDKVPEKWYRNVPLKKRHVVSILVK